MSKSIPSFVYNLDSSCKDIYVNEVLAFYKALHKAMIQYNIKHNKKNLTKRYMVKKIAPIVPDYIRNSFYRMYRCNQEIKKNENRISFFQRQINERQKLLNNIKDSINKIDTYE